MNYPFKVGETYFTPIQAKALKDFLSLGFEVGKIYTNSQKESRAVLKISLPTGAMTEETVSIKTKQGTFYHTPTATVQGDREAHLVVKDPANPTARMVTIRQSDWLKFVGHDFTVEDIPEPTINPAREAERKATLRRMQEAHKPTVEEEKKDAIREEIAKEEKGKGKGKSK